MTATAERRFVDWVRMLAPALVFLVSVYVGYRLLQDKVASLDREVISLRGRVAEVEKQALEQRNAMGERLAGIEAKIDILLMDRRETRK